MNTGIPFGVIPRGTANAFSVALGIPVPVVDACRNILGDNVRTVDGAMVNDIPMIYNHWRLVRSITNDTY